MRADNLFELVEIITTDVTAGGEVRANFGNATTGKGYAASAPVMGVYGFQSRPADADSSGAARVLALRDGDERIGVAVQDVRYSDTAGQLKPGGSVMFGKTGSFSLVDGDNGSWLTYVPYEFTGSTPAKAHALSFDVATPGAENVALVHGSGMAITMTAGDSNSIVIKNMAGDAYIEVNDDGITLNGNVKINGAIVMGDPATAEPVALAGPILAWASEVVTKCAANSPSIVISPLSSSVAAAATSGK